MQENSFYIELIFEYQSFSGKNVSFFLKKIVNDFKPIDMLGYNKFDNDSYEIIDKEDFKFRSVSIYSNKKEIFNIFSASQNRLLPRRFYTSLRFINKRCSLNYEELMYLLNIGIIKIGFEINNKYYFAQSDDNPQSYYPQDNFHSLLTKKELEKYTLPLYFNENIQLYRINISNNPGRERFLPGMKFIPAFKIWYGQAAQNFFGKEKILAYPHAIYTKELPNGVIEMQLMDKIDKCDKPYNQEKQRDIVKYFEIEKIEVSKY